MIGSSPDTRRANWRATLAARYPLARAVGFGCFEGWQPILARLLERLEVMVADLPADTRQDFRIEQIKQKFGRLLIYLPREGTVEMQAAIEEAGDASVVTCEVCAAPRQLAERNGWMSVRCQSGGLPPGLVIQKVEGDRTLPIRGTPTQVGDFPFKINLGCYGTNLSSGQTATWNYVLTIR